ncbi:helix-turn-helix domain-containing protein [Cerasicoccus maritimus]|uniref:helix-turn-helix domain-containing protein n=1 Tax=Cerasicoccus maritimus TaxID=490089 RepID=UPI002852977A|nr:helix-turn-helix transcriptional regulator [Cerasicoccus maritimus]
MSTTRNVAQLAAELADDTSLEERINNKIKSSRLTTSLIDLRLSKNINQKSVAERMSCDASKISRLESGSDFDWKFTDVAQYVNAVGYSMHISFCDEELPLADRIKQNVFETKELLDELVELANDNGDDGILVDKIHQFFGEVLFNFVTRFSDSKDNLPPSLSYDEGKISELLDDDSVGQGQLAEC